MPLRDVRHVLDDIIDTITRIEDVTAGKTLAEFQADWLLRHGVQRGIEIISEASRALPASLQSQQPEIPWPKVRAIGNVLRHEYHGISDPIIWRVVTDELPKLKAAALTLRSAEQ